MNDPWFCCAVGVLLPLGIYVVSGLMKVAKLRSDVLMLTREVDSLRQQLRWVHDRILRSEQAASLETPSLETPSLETPSLEPPSLETSNDPVFVPQETQSSDGFPALPTAQDTQALGSYAAWGIPPSASAPLTPQKAEDEKIGYPINAPFHSVGEESKDSEPSLGDQTKEWQFNWEEWIGVKGAAALAGIVLAVAMVFLVRYGIDHGWFKPWMRIAFAYALAGAALFGANHARQKANASLSQWLAGASIAGLYATHWAGQSLYSLWGTQALFVLLLSTTVLCGTLAVRWAAAPIAGLGLVGGFLTPILVNTGNDRPLALFGYLLALNLGLLFLRKELAKRETTSAIALAWLTNFALALSWLYQVVWLATRLDAGEVWIGCLSTLLFGSLFLVCDFVFRTPSESQNNEEQKIRWLQIVGFLCAFVSAWVSIAKLHHLQALANVGFWPMCMLLICLVLAAEILPWLWPQREEEIQPNDGGSILALAAELAAMALLLLMHSHSDQSDARVFWLLALLPVTSSLSLEVQRLAKRERVLSEWQGSTALVSSLGLAFFFGMKPDALNLCQPWTLFAAVPFVLARALGYLAQARVDEGRKKTRIVAVDELLRGFVPALLGYFVFDTMRTQRPSELWSATLLASGMGLAVALLFSRGHLFGDATKNANPQALRSEEWATLFLLVGIPLRANASALSSYWFLAMATAVVFSAWLRRDAFFAHLSLLAATFSMAVQSVMVSQAIPPLYARLPREYAAQLLALVAFALLPLATRKRWQVREGSIVGLDAHRVAVAGQAAASFATFGIIALTRWSSLPAVRSLNNGYLSLAIALLAALFAFVSVQQLRPKESQSEKSQPTVVPFAWLTIVYAAAALCFASVGVARLLENEWLTIALALMGLALLEAHRLLLTRISQNADSVATQLPIEWLSNAAVLFYATAFLRLAFNGEVAHYHPSGWPILNWLLYAYGVPTLAFALGARAAQSSRGLARTREEELFQNQISVAGAAGAAILIFVWMNLSIIDAWSSERYLSFDFSRHSARDLSLSIGWLLYAMGLLAIGFRKQNSFLRKSSLVMMLASTSKIFLMDLSSLEGLYRVGSLLGLAASLIVISVVYQRFVRTQQTHKSAPLPEPTHPPQPAYSEEKTRP